MRTFAVWTKIWNVIVYHQCAKSKLRCGCQKNFGIFLCIMSWRYKHKPTKRHHTMQTFINRLLKKIFNIFWPVFSTEEMWIYIYKKNQWQCKSNCEIGSGSEIQLRKDSSAIDKQAFSCNPLPRTMQKGKTKDQLEENTVQRTHSGKDLETGQGNSWKHKSANTLCSKVE